MELLEALAELIGVGASGGWLGLAIVAVVLLIFVAVWLVLEASE